MSTAWMPSVLACYCTWGGLTKRAATPAFEYRFALNGFAIDLTPAEAAALAQMPGVARVRPDAASPPATYGSTAASGAPVVWDLPAAAGGGRGEGVVIGVIDSGINLTHPAFQAVDADGFAIQNPRGQLYGVCATASGAASCNSKRIGVYDFVPQSTGGADTDGHGSHTAGIALGNVRAHTFDFSGIGVPVRMAGVAPRANLISYRAGDGEYPESAQIMALERAIIDQVDVISWAIGGTTADPWAALSPSGEDPTARAMTNAVRAGILFAAAAGNAGTNVSLTRAANLPWIVGAGATTSDRRIGTALVDLQGTPAAPVASFPGAGRSPALPAAPVVLGAGFGSATCADGPLIDAAGSGANSPWSGRVFNGEIVVCDLGYHSLASKIANVQRAGGGGVILVNPAYSGDSLVDASYSFPTVHLGHSAGQQLKAWVQTAGASARGRIQATQVVQSASFGPILARYSSTRPENDRSGMLRPSLSAPGDAIWSAVGTGSGEVRASGTSMAAPHVAGMLALLRQRHRDESPLTLISALELTADPAVRADEGRRAATPLERGVGAARIDRAAQAGLVLPLTMADFERENPRTGGNPGRLNTAALFDESCVDRCTFVRRVRAWRAGAYNVSTQAPGGVTVSATPAQFTLPVGGEQEIRIEVDISSATWFERFAFAEVQIVASDASIPTSRLTVAVTKPLLDAPAAITASIDQDRGAIDVPLVGRSAAGEVTASVDGPVIATRLVPTLAPGEARLYPLTLSAGVSLHAEISESTATDWDLYLAHDRNENFGVDSGEIICSSLGTANVESCRVDDLPAGRYYVYPFSYASNNPTDTGVLHYAVIEPGSSSSAHATLPSRPGLGQPANLRLAYDLAAMRPGERAYGSLSLRRSDGSEFDRLPLKIERTAIGAEPAEFLPIGQARRVLLPVGAARERIVVDVPAGATQLQISMTGLEGNADVYLAPAAGSGIGEVPPAPPPSAAAVSAAGPTANETLTLSAPQLTPGRWYVVPRNQSSVPIAVELRAEVAASAPTSFEYGVYYNGARDGHGVFFTRAGSAAQLVWYTYDDAGQPVWYLGFPDALAGGSAAVSTDLYRYAWVNGAAQGTRVGRATLTRQDGRLVYSWELDGRSGSEPMTLLANSACVARSGGTPVDIGGLWYEPARSGYGANLLALPGVELAVFYLYAADGQPRWVLGQGSTFGAPMTMYQYRGFCPSCAAVPTTRVAAGDYARTLDPTGPGGTGPASRWSLAVNLAAPLAGAWTAADVPVQMLTTPRACTP